jgi:hypothetical protein
MECLQRQRRPRWCLVVTLVSVWALLLRPARAADLNQLADSLKWIPADAAYYGALLHSRAQWDAIVHSRAWAKLKSLPAVQTAQQKLQTELKEGGSLAQFAQLLRQPENQQLIELLGDMFSEEVFFYGGPSWVGFLELAGQLNAAQSYGPLLMMLSGKGEEQDASHTQVAMLLRTLASNREALKIPDQIIGFKLSETTRARDQLKRLETLLTSLEGQFPPLKGRIKNIKRAGGSFLTITLDGTMVPWDRLPLKQYEQKEGEFDDLLTRLRQLQLAVAVGIRGGYLLVSMGGSTSLLNALGGSNRLTELPELKPLATYAGQRVTSITYVSRALRAVSQTSQLEGFIKFARATLPQTGFSAEQRARLRKGLAELAKLEGMLSARAGATLSFSFLSPRGSEAYEYDYGEHPALDASKPLTLLNHVGGAPLFALVGRCHVSPQGYHHLVQAIQMAYQYVEEFAVPKLDTEAKEKYEQIKKVALPSLQRLDDVTGTMLVPALANGQGALVLDAKLTSRQWFAQMPAADRPLPMLEPALVLGVSDAALLRRAWVEYRTILNELTSKVHGVVPDFPDVQIPEPETHPAKEGTLYSYPLPADWGIEKQIIPTAGLSDQVAVLTISHKHAERLLARAPLRTDGGPLADLEKPRAVAVYFNWARVVRAMKTWLEMGLRAAGIDPTQQVEVGDESWQGILRQVPTVLEVLQVFRSYSSSTYLEGPVLVTHSETVIRDL